MINIDLIYDMLSWDNDESTQQAGIEYAKTIRSLYPLILPILPQNSKGIWDNCAKVLASKSDTELEPYLSLLFEWFQDMNWPGASIIYNRLLKVNSPCLMEHFSICLKLAEERTDEPWKEALMAFKQDYYDRYR